MKAVIQRVINASVKVDGEIVGKIDKGLLVYLGVAKCDNDCEVDFIAKKISELRIFEDENGKMNLNVTDIGGSILIISNFTLYGNCQKGRRPGFDNAADPEIANKLYEQACERIASFGIEIQKGVFAAHMHVESTNDGPINFIIEK